MGSPDASELLPGTLDRLILKALARESMHGYGIAQYLRIVAEDVLQVGESSLYPAPAAIAAQGLGGGGVALPRTTGEAVSTRSRRPDGQAAVECREFDRMVLAINRVLNFAK